MFVQPYNWCLPRNRLETLCASRGTGGAMFLAGCHLPSCFAAEEQDGLPQFSTGRHAIFRIIDRSYRLLVIGRLDTSHAS